MSQSQRERLLAFVISVILCCMMSGSLSLLAKKSRDKSAVAQRTARVATPHEHIAISLSEASQQAAKGISAAEMMDMGTYLNYSNDTTELPEHQQAVTAAVRAAQPIGGNIVTAAILCLGASMCCAITAVGALLLLRGPRGTTAYLSEEGDSDEFMGVRERERREMKEASKGSLEGVLFWGKVDEITPEEAV